MDKEELEAIKKLKQKTVLSPKIVTKNGNSSIQK
jgi:hypothetical protein